MHGCQTVAHGVLMKHLLIALGSGLLASIAAAYAQDNAKLATVIDERASAAGREERCIKKDENSMYLLDLSDLLIAATPLELGDRFEKTPSKSIVTFRVRPDGRISNWKLATLSGSVARDFWTLYSVATAPAIKPPGKNSEIDMCIQNIRVPLVRTQIAEQQRLQLANSISRKLEAEYVYFPLIPATAIDCFKGEMEIETVTSKDNLVGIHTSRLWKSTNGKSGIEATKGISSDKELSDFLKEWSVFWSQEKYPSRSKMVNFARDLKVRYKSLLKEGEPEAPLP